MNMEKCLLSCLACLICLIMVPVPGSSGETSARQQLEASIDAIVAVLKDESLKGEANIARRREALRERIYERFDLEKCPSSAWDLTGGAEPLKNGRNLWHCF